MPDGVPAASVNGLLATTHPRMRAPMAHNTSMPCRGAVNTGAAGFAASPVSITWHPSTVTSEIESRISIPIAALGLISWELDIRSGACGCARA